MKNCPQCGKPIDDNDGFCTYCGAKLSDADLAKYEEVENLADRIEDLIDIQEDILEELSSIRSWVSFFGIITVIGLVIPIIIFIVFNIITSLR